MKLRNILCSGAAALALVVCVGAPSWAQNSQFSTPQERARTQELNQASADGEFRTATSSDYVDSEEAYNDALAQYDAELARYREELADYNAYLRGEAQPQDNDDLGPDTFDEPMVGDDDVLGEDDTPDYRAYPGDGYGPVADDPDPASGAGELVALDRFEDPNTELYNAPVVDIDGYSVGHFRRLEVRDNGDVMAVITLNAQRTISVPVEDVAFDPGMQVVVSDLTVNDFDVIPSGQ